MPERALEWRQAEVQAKKKSMIVPLVPSSPSVKSSKDDCDNDDGQGSICEVDQFSFQCSPPEDVWVMLTGGVQLMRYVFVYGTHGFQRIAYICELTTSAFSPSCLNAHTPHSGCACFQMKKRGTILCFGFWRYYCHTSIMHAVHAATSHPIITVSACLPLSP
jgi:hypothetical protein